MNPQEYEVKTVTVMDAIAREEFGDDDSLDYKQTLTLLLRDVENGTIFTAILSEEDVRSIVNAKSMLTSKEMIDLAIFLRQREDPLKLMVPKSSYEIKKQDIINMKPVKPKKRNRRNRRKKSNQNTQTIRKDN